MHQSVSKAHSAERNVEFKLLAACAIRPAQVHCDNWLETLRTLAQSIGDWTEFTRLVRRHQLPALAHDALARLPACTIPETTRQHVDALNRTSRLLSLAQFAESKRIAEAFNTAGIAGVQLKGWLLSERLYGDAYLRSSVDLDVLVPLSKINAAAKALIDLGLRPIDAPPNLNIASGRLRQLAYHHCSFDDPVLNTHTEPHWRLHGWPAAFAELEIENRIVDPTNGFARLRPEVELVDLLVHGTNHYWYFLKWLADIQQALITFPKDMWIAVEEKAYEMGATHALQLATQLAATVFRGIGPEHNHSMTPTSSAKRSARYALRRLGASKIFVHGLRSAVDRSVYRLASATPYGRMTAALRCVC